ncbi:murein transglycosylase A [Noviherbaspirillum galbum]|nr:MltA domain-containing protein [Noviherbaspirillum galbum]
MAALASLVISACTTTPPAPVPPPAAGKPPVPGTQVPPTGQPAPPEAPREVLRPASFGALPGWTQDDLRQAWPAWLASCDALIRKPEWTEPCSIAKTVDAGSNPAIRTFMEAFFTPYQVINPDGSDAGLVTGYYEPLLKGARKKGGPFQIPLHRVPDDLLTIDLSSVYPELKNMRLRGRVVGNKVIPYYPRAELAQSGALSGKDLVWVDDAIEAFFLQVQGSGRVQLADTRETIRVAYADQNGYPYKSIGRYLVDKGEMTLEQASAQAIRSWYIAHPERRQELLNANPSYVFFKEEKIADPSKGPKGALGVPLTPQRSIAVDPQFIPLGAPVFLSTTLPNRDEPLRRLVMAQDTGGAIRNPVRADFFWGFGAEAGDKAGKMKQRGSMWVLLPKLMPLPRTAAR